MKRITRMVQIGFATFAVCSTAVAGADKTLVSWVTLDHTAQQGGSALTIQRGEQFDGVVFGERAAGRWMAGSEGFTRTQGSQQANAAEKADRNTLIQMAVVYQGNRIALYRDGEPYASYDAMNIDLLGAYGQKLSAQAGYITIDSHMYRIMTLTIPCVINDLWTQAP